MSTWYKLIAIGYAILYVFYIIDAYNDHDTYRIIWRGVLGMVLVGVYGAIYIFEKKSKQRERLDNETSD